MLGSIKHRVQYFQMLKSVQQPHESVMKGFWLSDQFHVVLICSIVYSQWWKIHVVQSSA